MTVLHYVCPALMKINIALSKTLFPFLLYAGAHQAHLLLMLLGEPSPAMTCHTPSSLLFSFVVKTRGGLTLTPFELAVPANWRPITPLIQPSEPQGDGRVMHSWITLGHILLICPHDLMSISTPFLPQLSLLSGAVTSTWTAALEDNWPQD